VIALLQRVSSASVSIDGASICSINKGLLVFIGVEKADTGQQAERLAERLVSYRVFADKDDKMNLCLRDTRGELLLVPQFTLAADTSRGNRPGFSNAAPPDAGKRLFGQVVAIMQQQSAAGAIGRVETGHFGADMAVELVNDGPATFWLQAQGTTEITS
jgi:D-tyrosyl-tRNA(Tyr) deacylase